VWGLVAGRTDGMCTIDIRVEEAHVGTDVVLWACDITDARRKVPGEDYLRGKVPTVKIH
jgi:hypothetical protein